MEINVVKKLLAHDKQICILSVRFKFANNRHKLRLTSLSKTPIAICTSLIQFHPSVPSFVFAVLFKPFVNVLSSYFYVLFNLVARS